MQTPIADVTSYNNYYEFGTGKDEPVVNARGVQDKARGPSLSAEWSRNPRRTTSTIC